MRREANMMGENKNRLEKNMSVHIELTPLRLYFTLKLMEQNHWIMWAIHSSTTGVGRPPINTFFAMLENKNQVGDGDVFKRCKTDSVNKCLPSPLS